MSHELIQGAVDIHVHSGPSMFPREYDDQELAREAARAGMAGIVLKAHEGSTVERAILADRYVPGIRVMGGVVLNHFVGGLNPYAVELALGLGGKLVWLPTIHAHSHLQHYGGAGYKEQVSTVQVAFERPPLRILDDEGDLLPEVIDIIDLVKQYGAVLATGHISGEEIAALVRVARERHLERVVINHPELPVSNLPVDFQVEMARQGAYIERSFLPTTEKWGSYPVARTAEEIRQVGPERCLLETDLGQKGAMNPADGLARFAEELLAEGIPAGWIRRMIVDNPKELLGMK